MELSATAAAASRAAGDALVLIDPDQLRLVDGQIDLAAIELIEQPFLDVQTAIDELDTTLDDVASPWLIAPLQDRLVDLDEEIDDAKPKLDNVVMAVQVAPSMLGADGERRYFIAFTTPAETRGLGGTMETWAELTAVDGRLAIAGFGTTADLDQGGATTGTGRTLDGPPEWLDLWGEFGFTSGPNGGTEAEPWSNVTVSPQFPSTGDVIAQLYPQSGGDDIDGVFAMDPYVLEALLGLMGPITVEGSATPLGEDNVVDFLLVDQYEIDDSDGPDRSPGGGLAGDRAAGARRRAPESGGAGRQPFAPRGSGPSGRMGTGRATSRRCWRRSICPVRCPTSRAATVWRSC